MKSNLLTCFRFSSDHFLLLRKQRSEKLGEKFLDCVKIQRLRPASRQQNQVFIRPVYLTVLYTPAERSTTCVVCRCVAQHVLEEM